MWKMQCAVEMSFSNVKKEMKEDLIVHYTH